MTKHHWQNWGGNQAFDCDSLSRPDDETAAIALIQQAVAEKNSVRVAGSGHSFTPVVETKNLLLDLSALSGVIACDSEKLQALVRGGSTLASLGAPLWQAGMSIANQGDVDAQSIAGAIATGTKGSGIHYGSISSQVTSLRVVNGRGEVMDIDASTPELLRAAQVSLGMFGPVLRVGLQLIPTYSLREENIILPMEEVWSQWDFLLREYRHFSFWWMPGAHSADLYQLGAVPAGHCFVKLLREVPHAAPGTPVGEINRRTDQAWRIYPDGTTESKFHELEYMVDAGDARAAVQALQQLMLTQFPDAQSPLQVRWQKADQGFLSAQSGRDTTSLSVSGEIGKNYLPFLRAVDSTLAEFQARPHWGKLHFLSRQRVAQLYPDFNRFVQLRREMDPHNLFLNPHLAPLFS
ncbi:MAG: D-arabinono-1,4-lactone oxidase [Pantoea sp.]|uniref:D-arabinono-1,4-lactone oxidase n=1 Tax=Pantoea sp. TaxID=69393 RepID=UPI0039E5D820